MSESAPLGRRCPRCDAAWEQLEIQCPACGGTWRPSSSTDPFAYFGFSDPSQIWKHPESLAEAYRRMQRRIHPDRFRATAPELASLAAEHAAFASDLYRNLKDPRAAVAQYLAQQGHDPRAYRGTPSAKLGSILALAEDFATGALGIDALQSKIDEVATQCLEAVALRRWVEARDHWIAWQMLARIGEHRVAGS